MVPTPVMADAMKATLVAFAEACNFLLGIARELKTSNRIKIHHAGYRTVRERFGLSANLACRAIARVAYAIKAASARKSQVKEFHPTSVDYDQRIFAFREHDETASITTVSGRIHVPLNLGKYQRDALAGKNPTCASVVLRDGKWSIHIVVEETEPPKRGGPPLGIDLGIRNIATLSTGEKIPGKKHQEAKAKAARVRASLQSKGTRGAKRVLRRISGRERRRTAWVNHNVSKQIIEAAGAGGFGAIRMEDLRGIRARTRTWNKHLNRMVAGWSFFELQGFVSYKAERDGLLAETVSPWMTSQSCHLCHVLGLRDGAKFFCATHGEMDADYNAACNIAAGGAVVNRPESPPVAARAESSRRKPRTSSAG